MNLRSAAAALLALLVGACAPRLLPGTQIEETRQTRPIYDVVRAYAEAMQKKDAAAVLALVAPDYFDTAGTPSPEDDIDRAALEKALAADLARVDSLKLDLGIKKITVKDDDATAEIYYDGYFRVVTPNGPVPKRESDLHRMTFKRVGGAWKIVSGL
jgi:ketosteroid isomerase-like protein